MLRLNSTIDLVSTPPVLILPSPAASMDHTKDNIPPMEPPLSTLPLTQPTTHLILVSMLIPPLLTTDFSNERPRPRLNLKLMLMLNSTIDLASTPPVLILPSPAASMDHTKDNIPPMEHPLSTDTNISKKCLTITIT